MSRLFIGCVMQEDGHRGKFVHWSDAAVTETFGIFGVRGSGKSTTAKVLVEELTKAGQQCVIIDPLGVWYGLKSSADGKSEGLPFTVIGGRHADIPVNDKAGTIVADLVIETNAPLIIDLSQIRKAEGRRFMAAFLDQLWHRANGKPVHIVVDECDLYAPMKPIKGTEALLGSMEDLVRRGRNKGLGSTMISQRPASVHTDIRSQVSVLIAHRLTGSHDRAALDAWVEAHGDRERRAEMMAGLAALPTGVAWMWSPSFLDLFAQVAVREPLTFDSMATPKPGQRQIVPKKLAKPDVEDLTAKMASIIAEVEQSDPKALQRLIGRLELELRTQAGLMNSLQAQKDKLEEEAKQLRLRVSNLETELEEWILVAAQDRVPDLDIEEPSTELRAGINIAIDEFLNSLQKVLADGDYKPVADTPKLMRKTTPTVQEAEAHQKNKTEPPRPAREAPRTLSTFPERHTLTTADPELNGPMRKLLVVLATYGPRTKRQLAIQAGYAENGGAFANPLGKLRSMGYVTKGTPIEITGPGEVALGPYEQLPSGYDLVQHWMNSNAMSGPMAKILQVLIDRWPRGYERDELAEITGYAAGGGAFANPLGKLRTLGLVSKGSPIMLTDEFGEAIS